MKRRDLLKYIGATSAAAALAACAPKAAPTTAPQAEAPKVEATAAPAQPSKEEITLQLNMRAGGDKSEAPIYVERPAEFMQENPNIKVELVPIPDAEYYTKIQTMAAGGTLGDVVFAQDDYSQQRRHVVNGLLAVSDDWLAANNHPKTEWLPSVIDALTYEGKMYGLPKSASPSQAFIIYNKAMLDAAGIANPPKHGMTMENLVEWADKLTTGAEGARDVFGVAPDLGSILGIFNWVRAYGSFALNEEGTEVLADGPEWNQAVKYLYSFYEKKQVPSAENLPTGGRAALFAAGKCAALVSGRWEWKSVRAAVDALDKPFEWDCVEAPRLANAKGWRASVNTHDPSASTKHPNEAFMLAYALADQRQAELVMKGIAYCTARADDEQTIAKIDDKEPTKVFLQIQAECQKNTANFKGPKNLRGLELNTTVKNFLDQLWLGKETYSEDFMKRFKAACQEILDKPM